MLPPAPDLPGAPRSPSTGLLSFGLAVALVPALGLTGCKDELPTLQPAKVVEDEANLAVRAAAAEGTEPPPRPEERELPDASSFRIRELEEGSGHPPAPSALLSLALAARLFEKGPVVLERKLELRRQDPDLLPGLERGLRGLRPGGRREITIPADLAYGQRGLAREGGGWIIPPGATLVVEVELLGVGT